MGEDVSGARLILKSYQRYASYDPMLIHIRLHCTHGASDKGPNSRRCIVSAVSKHNRQKLFVATQDESLIGWLRKSGDVPIIKLNNNVVFLEHPAKSSKEYKAMVSRYML